MFCKMKLLLIIMVLVLTLLFIIQGCETMPDQSPRVGKDGSLYGVTGGIFNGRWWHYYERALSFTEGEFWSEAELDLREALKQRKHDQRRVRTYGMLNFIDYFPHRELGVVLYRQGRIKEGIHELAASLATEKSSRAEFYLDRSREKLIENEQLDHHPPEISIKSPQYPFLTNALSVVIHGIAKDDTFVRHIRIGGEEVRVDVSNRKILFRREVRVEPGENRIPVLATDLTGKTSQVFVMVNVDRSGPVVSIEEIIEKESVSEGDLVLIKGYAIDNSGLAGLVINTQKFPTNGLQSFQIHKQVLLRPGQKEVKLEIKDRVENVTVARLDIPDKMEPANLSVLMAEHADFSEGILSDATEADMLYAWYDSTPPEIYLKDMDEKTQITYLAQVFISGYVKDDKGVNFLYVNGKPFFNIQGENANPLGRSIYFNDMISLRKGENIVTFWYADFSGNSRNKSVRIIRKIPKVRSYESRLKVAIKNFKRTGEDRQLTIGFEEKLEKLMEKRGRFNAAFSPDEENELKRGKEQGFHCMLFGKIIVQDSIKSVDIYARLVDTETRRKLASVNIYDEGVDRAKLEKLYMGIEMKLTDEVPFLDGMVIGSYDKQQIDVDMGKETKIKAGMRLIVYQIGKQNLSPETGDLVKEDFKELGRAKVKNVKKKKSVAILDEKAERDEIKPKHRVITL